jgi:hypothetical protein
VKRTPCGQRIGLSEFSDSFACCSGVMPMPVSETASSIQSPSRKGRHGGLLRLPNVRVGAVAEKRL